MDYPNFRDRMLSKNGNGIWLHGTNRNPNHPPGFQRLHRPDQHRPCWTSSPGQPLRHPHRGLR
jgi:hypothetical protein